METVNVAQPKRLRDLAIAVTSSWTSVRLDVPGDLTFQNVDPSAALTWWQGGDTTPPAAGMGFVMPAGSEPLNIPVSEGQPYFWVKCASSMTLPAQLHF